jgi:putative FmdB family regulatory protein
MPIYEYRCTVCGHKLEALQKFTDSPLKACPACGKASLSKLVSAAGFQLKGSGWYATDFKGSGAKPAAKSDAGKDAESRPAEAKKSDAGKGGESKPAEATTSASHRDSKKASAGEAATAAPPRAATTASTANER